MSIETPYKLIPALVTLNLNKEILENGILPETEALRTPGLMDVANIITVSKNCYESFQAFIAREKNDFEDFSDIETKIKQCKELIEQITNLYFVENSSRKNVLDNILELTDNYNSILRSIYDSLSDPMHKRKGGVIEYIITEMELESFKKGNPIYFDENFFKGSFSIDHVPDHQRNCIGIDTVIFTIRGLFSNIESHIEIRLIPGGNEE